MRCENIIYWFKFQYKNLVFFSTIDRIVSMTERSNCKTKPEKTTRRIPENVAETWNNWCISYKSQYPDIEISKSDFASAAYLLFIKSTKKNISSYLKKNTENDSKSKQVSVLIVHSVAEQWNIWYENYDKKDNYSKADFTAAAFDMLMDSGGEISWKYINLILQEHIITEEISAMISHNIATLWDAWCKKQSEILEDQDVSKGNLVAAALTNFMFSGPKDIYLYITSYCPKSKVNKQVRPAIPNYVKEEWEFWCVKQAFEFCKSDKEVVSKSDFFASALNYFMKSKQSDINKYIYYIFSKDNYKMDIEVDDPEEIKQLVLFATTGKML